MRAVSDYRADVLTILGDASGRRYTNDMLDMGFREALGVYRAFCPRKETVSQTVQERHGDVVEFPVFPGPGAELLRVMDGDGYRLCCSVTQLDCRLVLNFYDGNVPAPGARLLLEFSLPHAIRGLDGAQRTTISGDHSLVLCKGAAAAAMRIRARSVTEVFGKRPEDRAALMDQAEELHREFIDGLTNLTLMDSYRGCPWGK